MAVYTGYTTSTDYYTQLVDEFNDKNKDLSVKINISIFVDFDRSEMFEGDMILFETFLHQQNYKIKKIKKSDIDGFPDPTDCYNITIVSDRYEKSSMCDKFAWCIMS